jgi:Kef-type K+ transport system membrane component KefB
VTGRGLRGRRQAQLMLAVAVVPLAFVALLFLAAPHSTGGAMGPQSPMVWLVPAIGAAGIVFGFVWMLRIYRADPEAHQASFRYRR